MTSHRINTATRARVPSGAGRTLAALACLLAAGLAHPQSSTINEATQRGLDVRSVAAPANRRMTAEQWHRRQLAAIGKSQEIMMAARKLPGLLGAYRRMQSAYDGDDEVAFRVVFGQYLSWYQTFVGDYDAARATFSVASKPQVDDEASPLAAGLSARPAADVILRLAQGRQAVFFNEAHSAPQTRTLTVELLAALREQGFDTFAAETLYASDEDLAQRGYPTPASGFYVAEPICGEMIRAALRLGYTVIAYDAEDKGDSDAREKASAAALYERTFERNPRARLVVNAGFSHIRTSGAHLGGTSMAQEFRRLSGIEPLAIEQTVMIGHDRSSMDHPWYAAATAAPHPDAPFVYVDAAGRPWTLRPGYDVEVFFPPQAESAGRPTWASLDGARRPYAVDGSLCRGKPVCLVEARYESEGDDAIPADRVVVVPAASGKGALPHVASRTLLYLYPGRYRLRASDEADVTLTASVIAIAVEPASTTQGNLQ